MILVGLNLSPFTRRIAVVMDVLGLRYERRLLSSHADATELAAFNPMGRVPTLVLDDGTTLCDSNAILHFLIGEYGGERLLPQAGAARVQMLSMSGISISVMEKSVALFVEDRLAREGSARPAQQQRMCRQIETGLALLDAKIAVHAEAAVLAGIDAVCAYDFVQVLPASVWPCDEQKFTAIAAFSRRWNREGPMKAFPIEITRAH